MTPVDKPLSHRHFRNSKLAPETPINGMKPMRRHLHRSAGLAVAPLLGWAVALTACATVEGIGRDISGGANRVNGWID